MSNKLETRKTSIDALNEARRIATITFLSSNEKNISCIKPEVKQLVDRILMKVNIFSTAFSYKTFESASSFKKDILILSEACRIASEVTLEESEGRRESYSTLLEITEDFSELTEEDLKMISSILSIANFCCEINSNGEVKFKL